MVASNVTFFHPSIQALIKSFIPVNDLKKNVSFEDIVEKQRRIHYAIYNISCLVPTGQLEIVNILEQQFPHKRFNENTQKQYVYNAIKICEYLPQLQERILDLILSKCLEIDVEIVIEDSGEVKIVEEYNGDNIGDEMFQFDDNIIPNNTLISYNNRSSTNIIEDIHKIPDNVAEMADKLDSMLILVVDFIQSQVSSFDSSNSDKQQRLFQQLLTIFENRILSTHKSKFVQYILFYLAARVTRFGEAYVKWLLHLFLDINQPHIKRQSAIMYIASYISRANFLSIVLIKEILTQLVIWAYEYVEDNVRTDIDNSGGMKLSPKSPKNSSIIHTDEFGRPAPIGSYIDRHETFYCCTQAICYILCFHGSEMAKLQRMDNQLKTAWENIILSKLYPLRYCLQSVRNEFIRLALSAELLSTEQINTLPSDIYQANELSVDKNVTFHSTGVLLSKRNKNSSVKMGRGSNPLDTFFPFDPCLLKNLHGYIEKSYRLWYGIPGVDLVQDDTEIDIDVDISDIPGAQDNDDDTILSSSMASSVISSMAHTYGTDNGIAMSISNTDVMLGENSIRAVAVAGGPASISGSENDGEMTGNYAWDNNAQGSFPLQSLQLPSRRPRQYSIGSAGSF